LIVGTGMGNDVAAARRRGASQVDAVEIDPEIIGLGPALRPEHPYTSPRVRVINHDARSFFAPADGQYDMIVFGFGALAGGLLEYASVAVGFKALGLVALAIYAAAWVVTRR
jgi:predicted membrane-bound spermidine synthase